MAKRSKKHYSKKERIWDKPVLSFYFAAFALLISATSLYFTHFHSVNKLSLSISNFQIHKSIGYQPDSTILHTGYICATITLCNTGNEPQVVLGAKFIHEQPDYSPFAEWDTSYRNSSIPASVLAPGEVTIYTLEQSLNYSYLSGLAMYTELLKPIIITLDVIVLSKNGAPVHHYFPLAEMANILELVPSVSFEFSNRIGDPISGSIWVENIHDQPSQNLRTPTFYLHASDSL